jgi:beta-phosphoglucomutase-like phosphatase (HAD superfamily)
MPFAGIIFDFNGVLWWDGALQQDAWNRMAVELRGSALTDEEMAGRVHGRTNRAILEYLIDRPVTGPELAQLVEKKEAGYRRDCLALGRDFRLSPGAGEALEILKARRIPCTIATASDAVNVAFFFQHLGLGRWFEIGRVACDDGTFPGKPAPDIYLRAARILDLGPGACVVVEDARSGIQAAAAAGIGCILALGPVRRHAELGRLPGVWRTIESLAQLPHGELFGRGDGAAG